MDRGQLKLVLGTLAAGAIGALLVTWLLDPEARNVLVAAATVVIAVVAVLGLLLSLEGRSSAGPPEG